MLSSQSCKVVVLVARTGLAAKPFGLRLALLIVNLVGPQAIRIDIKNAETIKSAQPLLRFGKILRTGLGKG